VAAAVAQRQALTGRWLQAICCHQGIMAQHSSASHPQSRWCPGRLGPNGDSACPHMLTMHIPWNLTHLFSVVCAITKDRSSITVPSPMIRQSGSLLQA
jgi:hypothetical protein